MVRAFNSVGSPTASPSSLQNFAPSLNPENRQRLAGKARHPAAIRTGTSTTWLHRWAIVLANVFGLMEMFRRSLPPDGPRLQLGRLANRLTKLIAELRTLTQPGK